MACVSCNNDKLDRQTLFLGLSVKDFSANIGWNADGTSLSVTLLEDKCDTDKDCWDECLTHSIHSGPDPGFLGEDLWERPDGTRYTKCIKEDAADTQIRPFVRLPGAPAYFRIGAGNCAFEWCGIIQNWQRTDNCQTGQSYYNINLVGPEVIVKDVQLILSNYGGCVNQYVDVIDGGTGCPSYNIFNIYGFLEHYGIYCPPMIQGDEKEYHVVGSPGSVGAGNIDGTVFGTPNGGFGGSGWNESGLPYSAFINGFNALVNTVSFVNTSVEECYAPYGRVCGCGAIYNFIGISGVSTCGLIQPDQTSDPCTLTKDLYYVDINELSLFVPADFRFNYDVISVGDLVEFLSQEFNFSYYWDLVPFNDGTGTGCIDKIIKLRTADRTTNPSLDKICEFVSLNTDCISSSTVGEELRNEGSARFLIGAKKQTVYQMEQNINPDDSDNCTINCTPDSISLRGSNTIRLPFTLDKNNKPIKDAGTGPSGIFVESYPPVTAGNLCCSIDNTILPYFGKDNLGNAIVPCADDNSIVFVDMPLSRIEPSLKIIDLPNDTFRISAFEMRAALTGYKEWRNFVLIAMTDSGQALNETTGGRINPILGLFPNFALPNNQLPRDINNPRSRQTGLTRDESKLFEEDAQQLFNFVAGVANRYYGKEFAIRVPLACCALDSETGKIRVSSQPTNDGGWTEIPTVLGLPNVGPTVYSDFLSAYFRAQDGKILPFAKFTNGLMKDVSNIPIEDYMYWYTLDDFNDTIFGNGEPSGVPTGSDSIYIDNDNGSMYTYYPQSDWQLIQDAKIATGSGPPPPATPVSGFCGTRAVGAYIDLDTDTVYITTSVNGSSCSVFTTEAVIDLYVKGTVEEEYSFYDRSNCCAPKAIFKIAHQIFEKSSSDDILKDFKIESLAGVFATPAVSGVDKSKLQDMFERLSGEDMHLNIKPRACIPACAAIPILHHDLRYGPWGNPSSNCQGTIPIIDDNMSPWAYGSYANLNTVGANIVNNARSDAKHGEIGQVSLVGAPCAPLGSELGAVDGGYYGGTQLVENRSMDNDTIMYTDPSGTGYAYQYYFTDLVPWTGLYGPNITSINVSTAEGCINTQYSMRSYTPRPAQGYLNNSRRRIDVLQRTIQDLNIRMEELRRRVNGL